MCAFATKVNSCLARSPVMMKTRELSASSPEAMCDVSSLNLAARPPVSLGAWIPDAPFPLMKKFLASSLVFPAASSWPFLRPTLAAARLLRTLRDTPHPPVLKLSQILSDFIVMSCFFLPIGFHMKGAFFV